VAEPAEAPPLARLLGQRVRTLRDAAGLSQSRVERDAGLWPATLARLERGELDPPVSEVSRIAEVLHVDLVDRLTP